MTLPKHLQEAAEKCSECGSANELTEIQTLIPRKVYLMCASCLAEIEAETEAQMKEDMEEYLVMVIQGLEIPPWQSC